jgi:hypothetical protein
MSAHEKIHDLLRETDVGDSNGRVDGTELASVATLVDQNGAAILESLVEFITRYVILTPTEATAVALWIVHSHAIDAAEATPYLSITSAEKESGKTRLQEVLELVVRKPRATAHISEAALFRMIEEEQPTLLFDEVDAIFGAKARDREDMRALLNAGHRRGRVVFRCFGDGAKMQVKPFEVFCAKTLAGIGELPETIASRSIPIRLKRKAKHEKVKRFRPREAQVLAEPLRAATAEWVETIDAVLQAARPELPDELTDRQQDGWEPLLAIADIADEEWPQRARRAAIELADGEQSTSLSPSLVLLSAIMTVFTTETIASRELIQTLADDEESPFVKWWNRDRDEPERWAPARLAKLLKPYGIKSKQRWIDEKNQRGYERADFDDAWSRYVDTPTTVGPAETDDTPSSVLAPGRII